MSAQLLRPCCHRSTVIDTFCQFTAPSSSTTSSSPASGFHRTAQRDYPLAEPLPLPANIDINESTRFSPQRHRDMNATILAAHSAHQTPQSAIDITVDQSTSAADAHIGRYDCTGAVSLCASMQSNVPSPFGGMHKFTHLNMPGGQYGQGIRLVASDYQQAHYYTQLRREARANWAQYDQEARMDNGSVKGTSLALSLSSASFASAHQSSPTTGVMRSAPFVGMLSAQSLSGLLLLAANNPSSLRSLTAAHRGYATDATTGGTKAEKPAAGETIAVDDSNKKLTRGEMLKRAVKEYGSTVIVFHVAISLASLGTCYALISR